MAGLTLTDKANFDKDGFVLKRNFFSGDEVAMVYNSAVGDQILQQHTYGRKDADGNVTKLALWYDLDDSICCLVARSERMVRGAELLLGSGVGHLHSKLMQKEPQVGGAWEWHQDYGYWYNDGFLMPHMVSVMVALTKSNKENGCLQVLSGSHHIGRINHGVVGGQKGADMTRVDVAVERFDLKYVEMEPGDTLFFHSNLLHRSDMNKSEYPRWSLISVYNTISNKPFLNDYPSSYRAIDVVPDASILSYTSGHISEKLQFNKVH